MRTHKSKARKSRHRRDPLRARQRRAARASRRSLRERDVHEELREGTTGLWEFWGLE